ncbi:MAG TPA: M28 family peptidase [Desulfosporosinus sp.]|nr:M28 family peptidase [Desulfosporosinus sp.]
MAKIWESTSSEHLMVHVENIAQWVRLSGSEEEGKSFAYIEQKLQEWGISYQRMTHQAYISWPEKAALRLTVGNETKEIKCITHSQAESTPSGGITGPLWDAGAGKVEDFAKFVPGSIALIQGLATPQETVTAFEAGASGIIYVNGQELHEMIVSPIWGSPSSEMKHLLPSIPMVSVLAEDIETVIAELQIGKCVQATLNTEVQTGWREIPLLVAEIPGNVYPDEMVMLAGHVDSWHYGAMDNASGNALQLEALRLFQERRELLQRTLRVAFWSGHSHGRYAGSTWYVDEFWSELSERLVLYIYADCIGGQGATVLSEAWAMAETKAVGAEAVAAETGGEFYGDRFGRGGDQSFYGLGVSALFMCLSEQPPVIAPNYIGSSSLLGGNGKTGGLGSWWHSTGDTIDKLDPEFLLRDARIYLYALTRYLEEPKLALDYRATVRELQGHLSGWQAQAGERLNLECALKLCDSLSEALHAWYERSDLTARDHNKLLIQLQRILIPLNFSTENRYEHGLALAYPPIPALKPIQELVLTPRGSAEEMHLLVLLKRRLNYVCDSLRQAVRIVRV